MVTLIKYGALSGGEKYNVNVMSIDGLSTDTKPTVTYIEYGSDGREIGRMGIPNGSIFTEIDTGDTYMYDVDATTWHKVSIGGGGGGTSGGIVLVGETTTALTDEATTNPITVDGQSYTAQPNDAVIYGSKEFLFDGTKWHEFGDLSGLASKDIGAMTGYAKPNATSAISTSDTLNQAVGKLEKALDGKQATIDANNKLSSDLVDDTSTTNKFATAAELEQIQTNKNNILSKANASDVNTATANLQAQINNIVTPVTQDAEVQNARINAFGTTYTTLKERCDSTDTEFNYFKNGRCKVGNSWVYATLDSNGDVAAYGNNLRTLNTDYYQFKNDTYITIDTGYGAILCEYNSDYTLHKRSVLVSGTYPVYKKYLYRVCVWYNTTPTTQPTPTYFAYNVWFKPEISDNVYTDISMFDDIAVCGDSYTAGSIFDTNTPPTLIGDNAKTRWGTVLQRMTGAHVTTYASGGADTNTYQSRSDCLPKILSDNPHELYILCLGINDKANISIGTIDDIKDDYTQNPNTFYGNYGAIIAQIKNHAPNAKIIISKSFLVTYSNNAYYTYSSAAIEAIAAKMGIVYVDTKNEEFFSSDYYNSNIRGGHPISATYTGIAKSMKLLVDKCIQDNNTYFSDYYPV